MTWYVFIELLIALISLFLYLGDVPALSESFKNFFGDLFSGANGESIPQRSSSFSSWDIASPYLGPDNSLNGALGGLDFAYLCKFRDSATGEPIC